MTIENRDLKPGTILKGRYQKQDRTCMVVEKDGKLVYQIDGTNYKSPSAAGKAITGHSCNGWVFWSIGDKPDEPIKETKAEPKKAKTDTKPAIPTAKGLNRCPNQQAVPAGKLRWTCVTCRKSFIGGKSATPKDCPTCNP